jgi:hypothetical protein
MRNQLIGRYSILKEITNLARSSNEASLLDARLVKECKEAGEKIKAEIAAKKEISNVKLVKAILEDIRLTSIQRAKQLTHLQDPKANVAG